MLFTYYIEWDGDIKAILKSVLTYNRNPANVHNVMLYVGLIQHLKNNKRREMNNVCQSVKNTYALIMITI